MRACNSFVMNIIYIAKYHNIAHTRHVSSNNFLRVVLVASTICPHELGIFINIFLSGKEYIF